MQYVFSMTSRMVNIAASCALLLCVLLFLLGVEIGARFVAPAAPAAVARGAVDNSRLPATDVQEITPAMSGSDSAAASAPSAASTY